MFVESAQFELILEKELDKPITNKINPKSRGSGKKYTIGIKISPKVNNSSKIIAIKMLFGL